MDHKRNFRSKRNPLSLLPRFPETSTQVPSATGQWKETIHNHDASYDPLGAAGDEVDAHELAHDHGQLHSNANDPTADEKAALAGTGTPSAENPYVTSDDERLEGGGTPDAHASTHHDDGSDPLAAGDIGACADDDARLSDARTPTAHAASHATGEADAIAPGDIGAEVEGAVDAHELAHDHDLLHSSANDPTSDEKAALAGTDGTPAADNPYVTDSDPRLGAGSGGSVDWVDFLVYGD